MLLDHFGELHAHFGFRAGGAFNENVGAVAHHRQHAFVGHGAELGFVGGFADQRIGIDLPIAGVPDQAERRADGEAVGLGDRVRQRDEIDLERAKRQLDPFSGISVSGTFSSKPRSRSFSRTSAAVNGVA